MKRSQRRVNGMKVWVRWLSYGVRREVGWDGRRLPLRRTGRHAGKRHALPPVGTCRLDRLVFYKGNEVALGTRSQNQGWEQDGKRASTGC